MVRLSITTTCLFMRGRKRSHAYHLSHKLVKGVIDMVKDFLQAVHDGLGIIAYSATLYAMYKKEKNANNGHS